MEVEEILKNELEDHCYRPPKEDNGLPDSMMDQLTCGPAQVVDKSEEDANVSKESVKNEIAVNKMETGMVQGGPGDAFLISEYLKSESDICKIETVMVDEVDQDDGQEARSIIDPAKFEVDVNQIESVTVEDQDVDIQSLGLTVYNQSTLERGIWDQVEKETRKRETQEQLASVSTKLKLAEEQLRRVTTLKGKKRSILQSALEEPSKKKPNLNLLGEHEEQTQEKVKELRQKQAELQAQLSSKNLSKNKDTDKESERERKIRMGEMTPFGTTVNAQSSGLSSFDKYLKSQQELHRKMLNDGIRKKHSHSTKFDKKEKASTLRVDLSSPKKKTSSKSILKKNVLFPKKRRAKEKLGTDTSLLEDDAQKSPGEVPGERTVMTFEDSGSEYIPSGSDDDDADFHLGGQQKSPSASRQRTRCQPSVNMKKDRWAGGSIKRRKKKVEPLPDGDPDNWQSDDSDWLCTDDEDFCSDDEAHKKSRHSKRSKDDGNNEEFFRRIKHWERQNEGLREQMEEDVHEFENGYKLPALIWEKLYTYQQVGVRWMWELNQQRCGGILGDEMGLGKTIQIISYLAGLSISKMKCRVTGYRGLGPTLIVCPTTVMHQWVREFHTWFPPLRVAILHESGSYIGKRSQLVRDMLHEKGIVITSYTAVVRLKDYLLHQRWHYVILDEGHKIRNPDAQITLAVKQLRTPHRLILSGSPLQNNLRELWSLMDFVFPGKLGTLPVFMSEFAVPINQGGYSNASEVMVATAYKCAMVLRDTISPYLLRRMKADVSDHIKLPSKNEQVLFCRLSDEQRELYKGYLQCGEVGRILEGRCQIFVGLINLRKICNHPHLYSGGPKLFANEKEEDIHKTERFGYWEKAGKMVVIEALLKMWHRQEHRVLIFTQSRQMLLIMEKFVNDCGYRYLKMDGGTSIAARQPLINKFNEDKSYFVMLLTTKVGGLGVNLTGANRVVIYDPDWNPATDTQARERAWRIGQQNAVTVYRLITAGTIEEKMYHRQIFKQFLCNKVLKDPRQRRFFKSNDLLELFTLKETDDGTTETSAIFAGTRAQVHVKPKTDSQKSARDKKASHHSDNTLKDRARKNDNNKSSLGKSKKSAEPTKISFSQDKLEHMKKLAHELSLKLSKKVSSTTIDKTQKEEGNVGVVEVSEERNLLDKSEMMKANPAKERSVFQSGEEVEHRALESDNDHQSLGSPVEQGSSAAEKQSETLNESTKSNCFGTFSPTKDLTVDDSDEELEDMKQLAQELGKELSQKVQLAAAINKAKSVGLPTTCDSDENLRDKDSGNNESLSISESDSLSTAFLKEEVASTSLSPLSPQSTNIRVRTPKGKETLESDSSSSPQQKKHKKHKKHKKRSRKDALLDGERVRGLVKSSTVEEKTKDEVEEAASHNAKQDDYVLRKLFSKAGIKTAMQHERIMESGHADYALVEGEARKVAQEAVKAMKASRQQCWNAMSGQPTWTGASGRVRTPGEIHDAQDLQARPQPARPKFGKRKALSKNTGSQTSKEKETEGEGSSSALLARIRARNLLLMEEDENDSTSAPAIVPDSKKELLDDIRTFVGFGASVDGRATTEEIVSQFRDRLPPESSALFKQMLMQICEFHRLPSGHGIWKLIPEFNW